MKNYVSSILRIILKDYLNLIAIVFLALPLVACDIGNDSFVAVKGISGVPAAAIAGISLTLSGTIEPSNATNQNITWFVKDAGTTKASVNDNILNTTAVGTVIVTAAVSNGIVQGQDFTSDFSITVKNFSITASSPSPTNIYIRWETGAVIESYILYRQSIDTEEYEYLVAINNDDSYLDTGLQPSTKYNYKIAYIDSNNTERFIGDDFSAITSPYLIAHRGYWVTDGSDQNSIKSLQLAAELGVYGSEFDVQLTEDNILVIYHDSKIKGTDITIQLVPYDAIKDVVLLNGEMLPILDDYLEAGKALFIQLILEIKPHATPERDREAVQIVVDKVKSFGLEGKVEYITFSLEAGKELIRLQPDSNVGYLGGNLAPAKLKEYGFSTLSYEYTTMQNHPEYFNDSKILGLRISVWTVNNLALMENMVKQGANLIITDIPHQARDHFKHKVYQYNF